jgi:hypothetical protein
MINGTDTTWNTFTPDQTYGCATNHSTALLKGPILSTSTIALVKEQQPSFLDSTGDTVSLHFTTGSNSYTYSIEKTRWLIVGLSIASDAPYAAWYFYADSAGLPALELVAIEGDTTLATGGGVRFKNIRINQTISTRPRNYARNAPLSLLNISEKKVVFHFAPHGYGPYRLSVLDMRGRNVFTTKLTTQDGKIVLQRNINNTGRFAPGAYLLQLQSGGDHRHAAFVWP